MTRYWALFGITEKHLLSSAHGFELRVLVILLQLFLQMLLVVVNFVGLFILLMLWNGVVVLL